MTTNDRMFTSTARATGTLALGLCALLSAAGCSAKPATRDASAPRSPQPVRIDAIRAQGQVKNLAVEGSLQAQQDFALSLSLDVPLHLYLVFEHADQRRELLHPSPSAPATLAAAGSLQLPGPNDTFYLPKVEAGDRLCLIAGVEPQSDLSCVASEAKRAPGRGEDQPPPPPPPPEVKSGSTAKPPPPPDDIDRDRGRGRRWMIRLPLSTS